MNTRYKHYLDCFSDKAEALRRIVACARAQGTGAAAGMSGADPSTIRSLCKRPRVGAPRRHTGGTPKLSLEDEARIMDARLAHPEAGALRLKRDHGMPFGKNQIERVLREAGLIVNPHSQPKDDPDFWIRVTERRVEYAGYELALAEHARALGYAGRASEVERMRRRLEKAKRKVEWWKSEKVRRERRERAEKMKGH